MKSNLLTFNHPPNQLEQPTASNLHLPQKYSSTFNSNITNSIMHACSLRNYYCRLCIILKLHIQYIERVSLTGLVTWLTLKSILLICHVLIYLCDIANTTWFKFMSISHHSEMNMLDVSSVHWWSRTKW